MVFLLQDALMPRPLRGTGAALRATTWFTHHRLVESSIQIDGRTTHARCAEGWFHLRGRPTASGSVLRLADGFTLLVVPPHSIEIVGGTRADRSVAPVVDLELGGCSKLFARSLQADAQNRRILGFRRETVRGTAVLALRVPIDATQVTLYLDPRDYRPLSLALVTTRGHRGTSRIHFGRLTTAVLRAIEGGLAKQAQR
jgi:hypothetical protein